MIFRPTDELWQPLAGFKTASRTNKHITQQQFSVVHLFIDMYTAVGPVVYIFLPRASYCIISNNNKKKSEREREYRKYLSFEKE